jgi:hypothetical protein
MQVKASFIVVAHLYGVPDMMAAPEKTSGQAAAITDVMAAPADRPVTKTRLGSAAWSVFILSTICLMERASPPVRVMSPGSNQLKQLLELLLDCCSG